MLVGTIGQGVTMVLLAILGSINNSTTQVISAVLLFVFNTFHAIGWLAVAWLYVSFFPFLSHSFHVFYSRHDRTVRRGGWVTNQGASKRTEHRSVRPTLTPFPESHDRDHWNLLISIQLDLQLCRRDDNWSGVCRDLVGDLRG